MQQNKIWDYFQNSDEIDNAFAGAIPRYQFLAQQILPQMNVLNIGVGRGGLEAILLKKNVIVSSLDPSEKTINKLREQYSLGDSAVVGFSQSIPFKDNQFDVVVMSEVLEHLTTEALSATLNEVKRVLKVNGRFIGTVPANEDLINNQVICPHCDTVFHRWGHEQSFSPMRLNDLLLLNGFSINRIEIRAFPNWHRHGLKNLIKSLIRYTLGRLGAPVANPNIFFEAIRL
jgi:SAM-dependent methyltransferase